MKSVSSWFRGLFHRLRYYRIENPGLKLFALFLASLLFVISRQPLSDVRLVGVQLEYRGLAQGLEISGDMNQSVSVRLRGPRDVVRSIMPNQIAVVADLRNKEPGDRVIQLKTSDVARPDSVEVLQLDPATIRLRIEPTTRRRVRVTPELVGKVQDGFEVYQVAVDPPMVDIQGPQSQVGQVEAVTTESVLLAGRTTNVSANVDVDHPNHAIRVVTPGAIRLSVEIGERRTTRRMSNLPVHWLDQPAGARLLTPSVEVELFGPRSLVDTLVPDQISVELTTSNSATPEVVLPIEARGRVEVRKVIPAQVRFRLP
jgi:YbbR domain-containing protein